MNKANKKQEQHQFLLKHGMKQGLVEKLTDSQALNLMSFALDHIQAANLAHMLAQLASMELQNKPDAAFLASNRIATIDQLKSLTSQDIASIAEDYRGDGDVEAAIHAVRSAIIHAQQSQLAFFNGTDYQTTGKKYHKPDRV